MKIPPEGHSPPFVVQVGLPPDQRQRAALLYDEAFGAEFRVLVPDDAKRRAILVDALELGRAIVAMDGGTLLGRQGSTPRVGGSPGASDGR